MVHFFGGFDVGFAVDAVFTALWWFGRVEACLRKIGGLVSCVRSSIECGRRVYLDEVLAFGFGDERLEFGCCEGVDESGLGDDQQQDLGAGQDGQFVGLESCG